MGDPRLPEFVTHYARGAPFRSVTAAGPDGWAAVVAALDETTAWGLSRYADPDYLPRRHALEARLRARHVARGGTAALAHPIYGFFGRNPRWERDPAPGMRAWEVPLAAIDPAAVTATFGDSLLYLDPDYRALVYARSPWRNRYCDRLFALDEVPALLAAISADDLPPGYAAATELIEVQLWQAPDPVVVAMREVAPA